MSDELRTTPAGVKVLLTTGEGVAIDWRDGHQSRYSFDYLRQQCPCATCRESRAAGKSAASTNVISDLPLYREPVRALQAEPIGHYAVRFTFSDNHSTGIYSFEYFRQICPCEVCAAAAREASP